MLQILRNRQELKQQLCPHLRGRRTESHKHLNRTRRAEASPAPAARRVQGRQGRPVLTQTARAPAPILAEVSLVGQTKPGCEHQNESKKTLKFHPAGMLWFENWLPIRRPRRERRAAPDIFGSVVLLLFRLNPHGWEGGPPASWNLIHSL